jgi:hypothetical protein
VATGIRPYAAMETRLIDSVHGKLGDLDRKVRAYRHDLLADFQRYYHDQLRDLSPDATSAIQTAIAQSLPTYDALRPDLDEFIRQQQQQPAADSQSRDPSITSLTSNPRSASFQQCPPSSVSGAAEAKTDLHEREKELQGLFTPSYLPLLDTLPAPPWSPPATAAVLSPTASHSPSPAVAAAAAAAVPLLPEPGSVGASAQAADMDRQQESGGAPPADTTLPQSLDRPGHVRRSTDDTCSSTVSDKSDTPRTRRKSALRQSSSSSKFPISPRRVRFEFEGAEVLPTASPGPSESGFSHIPPASTEPQQLPPSSIMDDEDEHRRLPPPRKISSSEALRALSRTPLEEGTVWTVVDPNSEKTFSEAQQETSPPTVTSSEGDEPDVPTPIAKRPLGNPIEFEPKQSPSPLRTVREEQEGGHGSDDDSSEDEFLAMAKPRKSSTSPTPKSPSSTATPLSPRRVANTAQTPTPFEPRTTSHDADIDEEAELFEFEHSSEDGGGGLTAPPRRPVTPPSNEIEEDTEAEPAAPSPHAAISSPAASSVSTAVPITKPASPRAPSTPTMARFQSGSIGSYKGRPVIMPVVRNPELHAQAASLGQFNTFVGGLDGRSGMDEGDLNSFRASLAPSGFSGTPRSMTERLMLEDAMERARGQSNQ